MTTDTYQDLTKYERARLILTAWIAVALTVIAITMVANPGPTRGQTALLVEEVSRANWLACVQTPLVDREANHMGPCSPSGWIRFADVNE